MRTRRGICFKIRYRVRTVKGKWKQKSELLYGLEGKKAARAVPNERVQAASNQKPETAELTLQEFVDMYWWPSLDRKQLKPSTKAGYGCVLKIHILPMLGEMRLVDLAPLHVEDFLQAKFKKGLGHKTVRNVLVLLQGIMALAVDNDLIARSPVRNRHKPAVRRTEKPVWTPEQVRTILANCPQEHRAFFTAAALTGARLGELLALQWKHVDFERRTLRIEEPLAWRVGDDKNRGQCSNDSVWRHVRGSPGEAPPELAPHWALGSDLLQVGWTATSSRRDAQGCALFHSRSFWHSTPAAIFWFPHVPAFGRQFRECANWQHQACSKTVGAFESEYDRRHLYAYVSGVGSRCSNRD